MIVQSRHREPNHSLSHNRQKPEVQVQKPVWEVQFPCKYFLRGTCTKSLSEYWHPPECQFYKSESGCNFVAECLFPHWKVEEHPDRKPKHGDDKSASSLMKSVRQLSCVSQDNERPESAAILGRAHKCWDQSEEYDSRRLHCVKQTSEKIKVRRWVNRSQHSSSAKSLRYEDWGQISKRDCKTRAMRPRRRVGTCQSYL